MPGRSRPAARLILVAPALTAVVAAGYLLRMHAPLPGPIRDAAGGAAYVVAVALGVMLLWPRLSAHAAAALGVAIACAVEVLQPVSHPWLDALRATGLGRLALGTTFAWGDFGPYAAGGLLAWGIARSLPRRARPNATPQPMEPSCPTSGPP